MHEIYMSFIGGGNWSTQKKPPTCRKSLVNFYHIMLYRVHLAWAGIKLKYLGRTEGQRDWGKTVYLPPPLESGGIKILYNFTSIFSTRFFNQMIDIQGPSWSYCSWIYDHLCNQCLSPVTLWVSFLDPSDSYFLFADLVGF
jgi:hypothetical protein